MYKIYKCCIAHFPYTYLCFPVRTVNPCFVSERVTAADPQYIRFDKILKIWATIVIQTFYILFHKSGQQSTLFESFSKHFYVHYSHVVKDSKQLLIIQLSTTARNSMQMTCVPCRLFIRFRSIWWTK